MSADSTTNRRIPGLDGIRALSILLVILYHLRRLGQTPAWPVFDQVIAAGSVGVIVFFVLSGFLITRLLLQEECRYGKIVIKDFYTRRALRILPPAITYLLAIALLGSIGLVGVSWADILRSLLFVRNYTLQEGLTGHFWSLSIEEQFYLIWPFFLSLMPDRKIRLWTTCSVIAFAPFWRQANYKYFGPEHMNHLRFDLYFDNLLIGCLLALVWEKPWLTRLLASRRSRLVASSLAFLGLYLTVYSSQMPSKLQFASITLRDLSIAVFIAFIATAPAGSAARWLFNWYPVAWVGRLSYSLYIWQQLFCADAEGIPGLRRFPLNVILTLACASVSYYAIETPFLRLRNYARRSSPGGPMSPRPDNGAAINYPKCSGSCRCWYK